MCIFWNIHACAAVPNGGGGEARGGGISQRSAVAEKSEKHMGMYVDFFQLHMGDYVKMKNRNFRKNWKRTGGCTWTFFNFTWGTT